MDYKGNFIDEVGIKLQGFITSETWVKISDTLSVILNKYELTERCTDMVVVDNEWQTLLKTFSVIKSLEGLADSTIKRYFRENKKLLEFLNMKLDDITTNDIRVYIASKRKENVGNITLDGMRRCYSTFFDWLYKEGIITKNPCLNLKQIKYKKEVKKPFTTTELEKLKNACISKRDSALVHFLYSTGCRVTEVSNLNIDNINFDTYECTVLGKGNKERIVYISDVAMMYLKEYLLCRQDNSNALFVGKGTDRLKKSGIEAMLKRLEKRTNIKNVHPHKFRRTLATNLLDRGMSIQNVAEILGHSDLKTTQIYCFIGKNNVKNSYKKYSS